MKLTKPTKKEKMALTEQLKQHQKDMDEGTKRIIDFIYGGQNDTRPTTTKISF